MVSHYFVYLLLARIFHNVYVGRISFVRSWNGGNIIYAKNYRKINYIIDSNMRYRLHKLNKQLRFFFLFKNVGFRLMDLTYQYFVILCLSSGNLFYLKLKKNN